MDTPTSTPTPTTTPATPTSGTGSNNNGSNTPTRSSLTFSSIKQQQQQQQQQDANSNNARATLKVGAANFQQSCLAYLTRLLVIKKWMEEVLSQAEPQLIQDYKLSEGKYFIDTLRDGVLICKVMSIIKPESIPKIHTGASLAFKIRENILFFVQALEEVGVSRFYQFQVSDLLDKKNDVKVLESLEVFADIASEMDPKYKIDLSLIDSGSDGSNATATPLPFTDKEINDAELVLKKLNINQLKRQPCKKSLFVNEPTNNNTTKHRSLTQAQTKFITPSSTNKIRFSLSPAQIIQKAKPFEKKWVKIQALVRGHLARRAFMKRVRNAAYRHNIVKEILSTEEIYVKNLEHLTKYYFEPIQENSSKLNIKPEHLKQMFSNIEVIKNYNNSLLESLKPIVESWSHSKKIGYIFIQFVLLLKVYTQYVKEYTASYEILNNHRKNNSKFESFIGEKEIQDGKTITTYLILPIQRIPRYTLLLTDLVKNTWTNHIDYEDLTEALKQMQIVATYVNEKKREAENIQKVSEIQSNFVGKFENLAEPHRRFVHEGNLHVINSNGKESQRIIYLFNDVMIGTKPTTSGLVIKRKDALKVKESIRMNLVTLRTIGANGERINITSSNNSNIVTNNDNPLNNTAVLSTSPNQSPILNGMGGSNNNSPSLTSSNNNNNNNNNTTSLRTSQEKKGVPITSSSSTSSPNLTSSGITPTSAKPPPMPGKPKPPPRSPQTYSNNSSAAPSPPNEPISKLSLSSNTNTFKPAAHTSNPQAGQFLRQSAPPSTQPVSNAKPSLSSSTDFQRNRTSTNSPTGIAPLPKQRTMTVANNQQSNNNTTPSPSSTTTTPPTSNNTQNNNTPTSTNNNNQNNTTTNNNQNNNNNNNSRNELIIELVDSFGTCILKLLCNNLKEKEVWVQELKKVHEDLDNRRIVNEEAMKRSQERAGLAKAALSQQYATLRVKGRLYNPADVKNALDESEQSNGGSSSTGDSGQPTTTNGERDFNIYRRQTLSRRAANAALQSESSPNSLSPSSTPTSISSVSPKGSKEDLKDGASSLDADGTNNHKVTSKSTGWFSSLRHKKKKSTTGSLIIQDAFSQQPLEPLNITSNNNVNNSSNDNANSPTITVTNDTITIKDN